MAAQKPAKPAAAKKAGTKPKAGTAPKATTKRKAPAKTVEPKSAPEPIELTPEEQLIASMDPRHVEFVEQYILNLNGTRAYKAAFAEDMSDSVAGACASRLLGTAKVQKLLACRVKAMFERTEGLQDRMLAQQFALAFADPNELVEHRRECCRYCYGINHEYQLKPSEQDQRRIEWQKEVREALAAKEEPPEWDELGGVGFDPRKEPVESCPECYGEGVPRIVMKDTRDLSPAAKALYAGAKWGKDGMEMLMHSQEKARDVLLKILKLYDDKAEVILGVVPQEKLDDLYAEALANAMAGRERTLGRKIDAAQEGSK